MRRHTNWLSISCTFTPCIYCDLTFCSSIYRLPISIIHKANLESHGSSRRQGTSSLAERASIHKLRTRRVCSPSSQKASNLFSWGFLQHKRSGA